MPELRSHRQDSRGKATCEHRLADVGDAMVQFQDDTNGRYPVDLGSKNLARKAIAGNPEAHHAAGLGGAVDDRDGVAEQAQMIGSRESGRAGADDEHAASRLRRRRGDPPALLDRLVTEEPLNRVDSHGLVDLGTIAGVLAGVIANSAHRGGQRIVQHQLAPGAFVIALFSQ